MELEQLRVFAEVAKTRNISRAAQRLYVSHSTVSRSLAALEEELGLRLVERGNSVAGLTEAGERLLPRAQEILALAEDIEHEMRDIAISTKNS